MTSGGFKQFGVEELLRSFEDLPEEVEQAALDASYAGATAMMDAWLAGNIWVDTGALKNSHFVDYPIAVNTESPAGFVAPYTNIVEVVHPTRSGYLSQTYAASGSDIAAAAFSQFELSLQGSPVERRYQDSSSAAAEFPRPDGG